MCPEGKAGKASRRTELEIDHDALTLPGLSLGGEATLCPPGLGLPGLVQPALVFAMQLWAPHVWSPPALLCTEGHNAEFIFTKSSLTFC